MSENLLMMSFTRQEVSHESNRNDSNKTPCFSIQAALQREPPVLYLYIAIQMKLVVQDVFFLKKKKKKEIFFLEIFRLLWVENPDLISGKMGFKRAAK